jgi:alpha-D-ribose 1-methylphosphonate 5-triphosphate synthase subunit PhnH
VLSFKNILSNIAYPGRQCAVLSDTNCAVAPAALASAAASLWLAHIPSGLELF